ncbi:MAG: PD40 domain-containing protein [Verrucomicrobia bacterium]|nr:PD40 domain-containing protein [Verrucomicrobiota bacterium]
MRTLPALLLAATFSVTLLPAQPASPPPADGQTKLLRFPATNGRQIVFTYAGQLYTVGLDGGVARRLTSAPGVISFPRFSADGKQLAFTGQYDGNTEVMVMPAEGGEPKRLTYTATLNRDDVADRMGPNNIVMTWKNKAAEVVFRSRMRVFSDFQGALYSVGMDGDLPTQLPLPRGGFVSFSPDDSKIVYNRIFREFRTWKRYRGGMADDISIYDLKTGAVEKIAVDAAQDICPMWASNGRIYFLSERDGRLNLYSYDPATKATKQLTEYTDWDIRFPSLGPGGIVYENAGLLHYFDLATEKSRQVPISVKEDFASGRSGHVEAAKHLTTFGLAPDGKRAAVGARGEIFSVPAKDGVARNLTNTSKVHERDAVWSPDGKSIAYVSDETGETEIFIRSADGKGAPVQLTKNADTYYYGPQWSPDSKKLAFADRLQRLRYVDVETKAIVEIDRNPQFETRQFAWSPDSKWIAWTRPDENALSKVLLYSLEAKTKTEVTDGWFAASDPSFSDDGKYLLLASSREFKPLYGNTEFNHIYRDMERIYLVVLAKTTENPLKPRSDEVGVAGPADKKDDKKGDDAKESDAKKDGGPEPKKDEKARKAVTVKVDLDGLQDRLVAVPVMPANYSNLRLVGERIFYVRTTVADEGDDEGPGTPESRRTLAAYSLKDRKETELGKIDFYQISSDGKKMLVKIAKDYAVIDLPTQKIELKDNKMSLTGLDMNLDRRAEWAQIYWECWRQMRDFFYAPNMHGVDWKAQGDKYASLLPWVNHRNDLSYLIAELISELNAGHAYVGGGERPEAPRIRMGLLGAELSRDAASKAYRIDRILRGENWQDRTRSPLTEIGVDVKEGDFILAVNGQPVAKLANIYEALVGTAGKQVTLRVNGKPTDEGAREVVVVPIASEASLYYHAWVQRNIDYVSKKTDGKVGYLHIPDMGRAGLNEFVKHFYPQLRKKALVVDVRGNGGGNVSPMIIERLRRELVMVSISRNGMPQTNPGGMILGPMVALLNEWSASDGDIFPYRFRQMGLGKLVGKRSWGGVVGIRNSLPLTDGSYLNRPEFAPYSKDGKEWVMEGHGVDPDIVVENEPLKEFKGEDQQLDKAVEVVLEELKTKGRDLPPVPPYPIKKQGTQPGEKPGSK